MTEIQNKPAVEPKSRTTRFGEGLKIRKARNWAALAILGVTSALTAPAQAIQPPTQYSIANIVPSGVSSYGYDINNSGNVAGEVDPIGTYHAFYYDGATHDLHAALGNPSGGSYANSLNDSGVTTGLFYDASGSHAFIYSPASNTAQDLSSAFPAGTTDSDGLSINSSNTVVGTFYNGQTRAFRYSGGVAQDLSSLFPIGTNYSDAYGINDSGNIAGEYDVAGVNHAYLYSGGLVHDLNPSLNNTTYAYANDLNNNNQVVGRFEAANTDRHAFLYSNGSSIDINNLLPSGADDSTALGINNSGQVVGNFSSTNFSGDHAFVYSNGVAYDLNNLIGLASGWVLNSANSINNSGQITGTGIIGGQSRAFVLSLRSVFGNGTISSGKGRGNFYFGGTGLANSPGATGFFYFYRNGGPYLINGAPIEYMTVYGNVATFGGVYTRDRNGVPITRYEVTLDQSANTFTLRLYHGNNVSSYATYSGVVTSGGFIIS